MCLQLTAADVKLPSPREALAFNAPHEPGQADCTPARAAEVWAQVLAPLQRRGWRVGSPGVNAGNARGLAWMHAFWRECDGFTPDFLALHFVRNAAVGAGTGAEVGDGAGADGSSTPTWASSPGRLSDGARRSACRCK